jgi:hypothetical protein
MKTHSEQYDKTDGLEVAICHSDSFDASRHWTICKEALRRVEYNDTGIKFKGKFTG